MPRSLAGVLFAGLCLLPAPAMAAQRIVTLAPHLAEMVCLLGRCEQLVGVVAWTDYPQEAANKTQVGDAFNLNLERILALQPDLVLAWRGGTPSERVGRLETLGLNVAWIDSEGLDAIATAILDVGGWIGAEDRACAFEARYRERLATLRARYAREPGSAPWPSLYQIQVDPVFTVNAESPISEAIELCGGRNVFADLPQIAAAVGAESIIAREPALIIYGNDAAAAQVRRYWSAYPSIPAVSNGRFVAAEVDLLARQSPRILDGVERLCEDMRRVME